MSQHRLSDRLEQMVISRVSACEKAQRFRVEEKGKDPYPHIRPALLSADHVIQYAQRTGMISPIFEGGSRTRMKKASYEGRIGSVAYEYDEKGKLVPVSIGKNLIVKANSIVFVECDIDFRLPDFIAVRFNLHIRHVHRGLLLGTGPLVDPGYWGKLCIPLHNLTSEDYPIPRSEGLIWMEFTKTSALPKEGRDPRNTGFWCIRKFITSAAAQYGNAPVSIRSSIPAAMHDARDSAKSAEKSAISSKRRVKRLTVASYIALFSLVISFALLTYGAYRNVQSAYNSVESRYKRDVEALESEINAMKVEMEQLRMQIKAK